MSTSCERIEPNRAGRPGSMGGGRDRHERLPGGRRGTDPRAPAAPHRRDRGAARRRLERDRPGPAPPRRADGDLPKVDRDALRALAHVAGSRVVSEARAVASRFRGGAAPRWATSSSAPGSCWRSSSPSSTRSARTTELALTWATLPVGGRRRWWVSPAHYVVAADVEFLSASIRLSSIVPLTSHLRGSARDSNRRPPGPKTRKVRCAHGQRFPPARRSVGLVPETRSACSPLCFRSTSRPSPSQSSETLGPPAGSPSRAGAGTGRGMASPRGPDSVRTRRRGSRPGSGPPRARRRASTRSPCRGRRCRATEPPAGTRTSR